MTLSLAGRIAAAARAAIAAALIGGAALGLAGAATAAPTVDGTLYGDPTTAAQYWAQQNLDDCALMATADVIGQLTGDMPSEEDIVGVAAGTPSSQHPGSIYFPPADLDDPNSGHGTHGEDVPVLLAQYGIDAVYTDADIADAVGVPTGMAALQQYLADGQGVIAYVNAETIWGEGDDFESNNHALVVTGVDTARGVVHLNDSGVEDGRDKQVSIATFQQAWDTGDDSMVVTLGS